MGQIRTESTREDPEARKENQDLPVEPESIYKYYNDRIVLRKSLRRCFVYRCSSWYLQQSFSGCQIRYYFGYLRGTAREGSPTVPNYRVACVP
jgi:hypothetical protein